MARWITPSNGLNQYDAVGGVTLGYDDSGNLTGDGVWTYAYDAENRLVYASDGNSTTTYAYDPKGRRIIKDSSVTGETQYLYEGDEPIAGREADVRRGCGATSSYRWGQPAPPVRSRGNCG